MCHLHQCKRGCTLLDKRRRGAWAACLAALLALWTTAPTASAGLAVSPLQQHVYATPGSTASFAIKLEHVVRKNRIQPIQAVIEVVDFDVSLEGKLSFGPQTADERSARNWIKMDAERVSLRPGEKLRLAGTVSVPTNAEGDYWAAVMVTLVGGGQKPGVNVVLRTACGVFVHAVRYNHPEQPRVATLTVSPVEADAASPDACITATADLANDGVVGLVASGMVTIYQDGRRHVANIPLHARRRHILPGDVRRYVGVLADPLPPGRYVARCTMGGESNTGRRAFAETEFTITPEVAAAWQDRATAKSRTFAVLSPSQAALSVTPGRFTTATLSVSNECPSTMQATCRLEPGSVPPQWLALDPESFTLGPRMRRSVLVRVNVPPQVKPGDYHARLILQTEVAGLSDAPTQKTQEVPIDITVKQ